MEGIATIRLRKLRKVIRNIPVFKLTGAFCVMLSGAVRLFGCISPFGAACSAALLFRGANIYMLLLPVVGAILATEDVFMLKYMLAVLLMTAASANSDLFLSEKRSRMVCAICMLAANLVYMAFLGFSLKGVGVAGAETILAFAAVHPYRIVLDLFCDGRSDKRLKQEGKMCIVLVCAICICGISALHIPGVGCFLRILAYFSILFCANMFSFGVCAVFGIVVGILLSLPLKLDVHMAGAFCLAALVCRCCKPVGKSGVALGLLLTKAMVLLASDSEPASVVGFVEVFVGGMLFLCVPEVYMCQIKSRIILFAQAEKEEAEEREVFRKMTVKRLARIADAFSVLATSMGKKGEQKREEIKTIAAALTEDVYQRTCGKCKEQSHCKLSGKKMYTSIQNILKKTVARGRAEQYDLSSELSACLHKKKVIDECNKMYELYRVNQAWENRINENRMLVSKQLEDVSDVVRNLANEITETAKYEKAAEEKLALLLSGLGIYAEKICVLRDIHNRLHIELSLSACKQKEVCNGEIKAALRKVFDTDFSLKKGKCNKEKCRVVYREQEKFSAQIGIARVRPKKEDAFGDSYAVMYPEDGKVIVALSDGMGTGERAAKESKETVGLLEKLVMAGIDREMAVKLINSVLVLRSFEDGYATLDLLLLDLYVGEGSLIKNASANSYVCRENRVGVMASRALPPGVIGEVETSGRKFLLKDGDVVLLVSDGVTDAEANDEWIKAFLLRNAEADAQASADKLIAEAKRRASSYSDDMTAILIKISEK